MSYYPKINAAEIKSCFDCFDEESRGSITKEQAATAIRALGYNPLEGELENHLKSAGDNIDFATFKRLYENNPFKRPEEQDELARKAFRELDADGDGTVPETELRQMLISIGEQMAHNEVDICLEDIKVDNQGRVHYEEFITLLVTGCTDLLSR